MVASAPALRMCSTPSSGMVADVEAEHLALVGQQQLLVPLAVGDGGLERGVGLRAAGSSAMPSPPNSENCPAASARLTSSAASMTSAWICTRPRRGWPSESKAPALIRDSTVRLLQATGSTLRRKSAKSANAPLALRVRTSESTTLAPTLRMAPSPKRISVPRGVKSRSESLTSGGSTLRPIRRHSCR